MKALLHSGRAVLAASWLYFVVLLVGAHPPYLAHGAIRTETAAIAISKRALAGHDPYLARDDHGWRAWLDCEYPFESCRWTAGFWDESVWADSIIDPTSGAVRETRMGSMAVL